MSKPIKCEASNSNGDAKIHKQEPQIIKKIDLNEILPSMAMTTAPSHVNVHIYGLILNIYEAIW